MARRRCRSPYSPCWLPLAVLLPVLAGSWGSAQTNASQDRSRSPSASAQIGGPEGLRDYVVEGKLRLALDDAVRLALLNNTEVRLNQLPLEEAHFAIQRAYQPFDPSVFSSFSSTRSTAPTFSQLQGAPTLSSLSQQTQVGYQQTFQTGTQVSVNLSADKSSTNSRFVFFNPSILSGLRLSLIQPLLRNRGVFPNRARIVIAQRSLNQSRATFEASVNDSIWQAVTNYWAVVEAREGLQVRRRSLEEAEATYRQNKRALELGALPPLDIYLSESQVASRRVAMIQAEYGLKQAEDLLRRAVGADLDPYIRALDLELAETAEPTGDLLSVDIQTALEQALTRRPELEGLRQQLANDETSVRLARNRLLPDLTLAGIYSSSGLGGNQFSTTSPPMLIARGGLGDALGQVFGFGFPTYGVTLQLNFPLKNREAAAELGNARVGRRRSLYQVRQKRQDLTLEVSNAVHRLEQAKLSMAAAKIARDLAQKTLEAEQRKYELGSQPIFFVLQAQTQLAQAELGLVQAQIGYQLSTTELQHATGTLLERYRVQIAESVH